MSCICKCLVKLKNVNKELFKQVMKFLAAKHYGHTITAVEDFYGNKTKVDFGITTSNFSRGLGVVFKEDGTLEFLYDSYGCEREVEALKNEIVQNYTADAVVVALNALGYQVQAQEINKQIIINGVK